MPLSKAKIMCLAVAVALLTIPHGNLGQIEVKQTAEVEHHDSR
ncbi:MAG: hypothetical protein SVC26_01665 [Pseudomonadota bacterium]|nr:hypothetical protein [Pseudomonadota bacterium]